MVDALFVLFRAVVYATIFVGLVLVAVPASLVERAGLARPALGLAGAAGLALVAGGAALALTCILAFALIGRGTPAPFDPPRRLVTRGPYRVVRNPMYIGAGLVLAGAALVYRSLELAGYAALFAAVTHAFVVAYEEPTLGRLFGAEYEAYRRRVRRWWPRVPRDAASGRRTAAREEPS